MVPQLPPYNVCLLKTLGNICEQLDNRPVITSLFVSISGFVFYCSTAHYLLIFSFYNFLNKTTVWKSSFVEICHHPYRLLGCLNLESIAIAFERGGGGVVHGRIVNAEGERKEKR